MARLDQPAAPFSLGPTHASWSPQQHPIPVALPGILWDSGESGTRPQLMHSVHRQKRCFLDATKTCHLCPPDGRLLWPLPHSGQLHLGQLRSTGSGALDGRQSATGAGGPSFETPLMNSAFSSELFSHRLGEQLLASSVEMADPS